ncbi:hypothetical protein VFPPC_17657 [Pochonia chlamydosporia 170]|uniref:Uncharacterized protein n=1 Tax=Pochonia chlamydosporia 170 TaxID=1380566 RepID=A0A219AQV5_METCM|nr:hypothetical protein VFPPC_17657 [Pochonia chlamydosporia 170]OWT43167.1 hypothetical protein VFPPC_17657 [Pochonia chlamydosporia 170]
MGMDEGDVATSDEFDLEREFGLVRSNACLRHANAAWSWRPPVGARSGWAVVNSKKRNGRAAQDNMLRCAAVDKKSKPRRVSKERRGGGRRSWRGRCEDGVVDGDRIEGLVLV